MDSSTRKTSSAAWWTLPETPDLSTSTANNQPLHKMKTAVTFNSTTYAITSPEIARAMIFAGNPYGHNRAKLFGSRDAAVSFARSLNLNPVK